jgi:Zn-dependent protease
MNNKPLFSIFGFPVIVQPLTLAAAALAVMFLGSYGLILALTLFFSILVHELGHSLMFRRFGSESHIVIHIFGGYSAPSSSAGLTDSQWVKISAAGPLGALALLGIPALLVRQFLDLSQVQSNVAYILVLFNVYWGLANLAPIWPFDGGRILYHSTTGVTGKDQWQLTKMITLIASAGAIALALYLDYRFAAFFVGYNAYQVFNSPSPRTLGIGGGRANPITEASARARSNQPRGTAVSHSTGGEALVASYEWIIRRRWDKASGPVEGLMAIDRHRVEASEAAAWHYLLDHNADAATQVLEGRPLSPLMHATWTLLSDTSGPIQPMVQALRDVVPGVSMVPALMLIREAGRLGDVCLELGSDQAGRQQVKAIEQVVLHQGLVQEQIAVSAALHQLDNPA